MLCLSGLQLYSRWVSLGLCVNRTETVHRTCAFPVCISLIVCNICENLHYESVYFKGLDNEREYY